MDPNRLQQSLGRDSINENKSDIMKFIESQIPQDTRNSTSDYKPIKVFKNHIKTDDVFFKPERDRSSSVRRTSKRLGYREADLDSRLLSYEKI